MNNIALNSLSTVRPTPAPQAAVGARGVEVEEVVGAEALAQGRESKDAGLPPSIPPDASPEELEGAVEQLNGFMQMIKRELRFSVDDDSGRTVIKVIDSETQEIIRQIPPEQVERFVHNIGTGPGGLMPSVRA